MGVSNRIRVQTYFSPEQRAPWPVRAPAGRWRRRQHRRRSCPRARRSPGAGRSPRPADEQGSGGEKAVGLCHPQGPVCGSPARGHARARRMGADAEHPAEQRPPRWGADPHAGERGCPSGPQRIVRDWNARPLPGFLCPPPHPPSLSPPLIPSSTAAVLKCKPSGPRLCLTVAVSTSISASLCCTSAWPASLPQPCPSLSSHSLYLLPHISFSALYLHSWRYKPFLKCKKRNGGRDGSQNKPLLLARCRW